jgi:hypothetical protein
MQEKPVKRLVSVHSVRLANQNLMTVSQAGSRLGSAQHVAEPRFDQRMGDVFSDLNTRRRVLAEAGKEALRAIEKK